MKLSNISERVAVFGMTDECEPTARIVRDDDYWGHLFKKNEFLVNMAALIYNQEIFLCK